MSSLFLRFHLHLVSHGFCIHFMRLKIFPTSAPNSLKRTQTKESSSCQSHYALESPAKLLLKSLKQSTPQKQVSSKGHNYINLHCKNLPPALYH